MKHVNQTIHLGIWCCLTALIAITLVTCSGKSAQENRQQLEEYLQAHYSSKPQLQKALRDRLDIFERITVGKESPQSLREELDRSLSCVRYLEREDFYEINRDIAKRFFNTSGHLRAYARFNAALSGGMYELKEPSPNDCPK